MRLSNAYCTCGGGGPTASKGGAWKNCCPCIVPLMPLRGGVPGPGTVGNVKIWLALLLLVGEGTYVVGVVGYGGG